MAKSLTIKRRVYVWNEQRERWESESGGPLGNSLACRQEDLSALAVAMNALRELRDNYGDMTRARASAAIKEIEGG